MLTEQNEKSLPEKVLFPNQQI